MYITRNTIHGRKRGGAVILWEYFVQQGLEKPVRGCGRLEMEAKDSDTKHQWICLAQSHFGTAQSKFKEYLDLKPQ